MFSFFLLLKECIFNSSFGTNHFGNKQKQLTGFSALVQEPGYLHQTHVTISLGFSQCSSCRKTGYLGQHKGTSDILIIVFHWGFHGEKKPKKQNKTKQRLHFIYRNSNLAREPSGLPDGYASRTPPRTMASVKHLHSLHSYTHQVLTKSVCLQGVSGPGECEGWWRS